MDRPSRSWRIMALLPAIALAAAVSRPTESAFVAAAPSTVVSLDLSGLLAQLDETAAVRMKLEKVDAANAAQKKERDSAIAALQDELETLQPDTPAYREHQERILQEAANLEAWVNVRARVRALDESLEYIRLYDKIVAAAAEVAEAQGYDFILLNDSDLRPQPGDPAQTVAQMFARRTVYARPARNVTGDIADRMNNAYRAAGG